MRPGSLNWQHTNLNVTSSPTEPFGILSTTCDRVADEWREVIQEVAKVGETFRNYLELSILFSQHLDWNQLAFLPVLSQFDLEH